MNKQPDIPTCRPLPEEEHDVRNPKPIFQWGSLRTKIIAWSFVPTAIILVAVALVTFIAYQRVTEDLVIERDQELTRLSAGQLTAELSEYAELLATEARTAGTYGVHPTSQRITLQRAKDRLVVFDGGVVILDTFGTVVAAEPERSEAVGQNWSDRSYYRQMLRAPGPVFSDIVADGSGSAEVIVVAVPITGPQDEFLGTIAGMFRLGATAVNAFYGDLVKLHFGESGSAYLVDGDGRVIYHSDTDHIGDDFSTEMLVQQVLNGQVGSIRTHGLEGQDIVASFAPVPGTSWGLVTEESWAALISPSQGYRQFLLLLLALGVVVPALVVAVGTSRITRPIAELISAAQAVAGGNFGQRITAHTGDEVEELAEQFSLMSAQLRESYAHLEQRVANRTKELASLNAIAAVVSRSLELETMLTATLDKVLEVLEFESGAIYLRELETGELQMTCHRGLSDAFRRVVAKGIISAQAAETGNPVLIDDLSQEPDAPTEVVEEGYLSVASIPLLSKGQVQGVLTAVGRQLHRFRQQDVDLLLSIGRQIGVAIENARLFEAEHRRRQEATLLVEMARLISGTLNLDEVLRLTAEYAVEVFDAHCCCIFLYDERKGTLRPATQVGFDDQVASAIIGVEFSPSQRMQQRIFEDLQPLIIEDVPSDPHLHPQHLLNLQSVLVVPIEVGGQRLGAMQLGTQQPKRRRFTADEEELALAMANQAAMAIENARLFEAEQRRAEQFRVISEVGHRMTSILAVDELLNQTARLVQEAFNYYHVGFGLIEGDELVTKAGAGPLWDAYQSLHLKVGQEGVGGWVAQSGEPLLVPDVSQEPRYYFVPQASEIRSELCVPLRAKEAVIGVLDVQSDQLNAFDESDLAVLQSLAHQAAIAIENARLYRRAWQVAVLEERQRLARELHDAVTQTLFSSSLIAEVLPRLWERNPDEGKRRLAELHELTRGALAEMRTLLLELRPAALVEAELGDLLRQLAESIIGQARVPVAVVVEGEYALPPEVKVALYRIAQEALNNAIKHAGASQVSVSLHYQPQGVELYVCDDGRGFDPTHISPDHLGLSIMHERSEAVGATLKIESQVGQGTQVGVVWTETQMEKGATYERVESHSRHVGG